VIFGRHCGLHAAETPMRTAKLTCPGVVAAALTSSLSPGPANGDAFDDLNAQGMFCSATAQALFRACGSGVVDDYWVAVAICNNEPEKADRTKCLADAKSERSEATQLCGEQFAGRRAACKSLGEARYDPPFEPRFFDADFTHLTNPNRYFPLAIGNQWEYRSQTQSTKVQVLDQTKLIDEVRCVVVLDQVREGGDIIESTNDWFAQAKDGTVWYCGEETASFETFDGDRPRRPELVSIEGSFKAGRDGDKPGIIFEAAPAVGDVYIEESSLDNAEDATQILSISYSYGRNPTLDQLVPAGLAKLFCAGDCVVTKNYSLLEPGSFERKYYAPGIGVFLEVEPDSGEVVQLVNCNFDSRCAQLGR
jgi:hypothetical protein